MYWRYVSDKTLLLVENIHTCNKIIWRFFQVVVDDDTQLRSINAYFSVAFVTDKQRTVTEYN